MPSPNPPPGPDETLLLRFRRGMKWAALLSITVAGAAVALVAIGDEGINVHALIATALGAGLTVLLGTGLMMLVFLSSSSGHDDSAAGPGDKTGEKE